MGTCEVTELLVIFLRTLVKLVTQRAGVETHRGCPAAVEAGTLQLLTALFILTARTVDSPVTAYEDGQAVAITWTLEMGLWAQRQGV